MLDLLVAVVAPTSFANTPTAAVLPAGAGVVTLGYGGMALHVSQRGSLGVQLGVGSALEVAVTADVAQTTSMPPFNSAVTGQAAVGLKRGLGMVGGWDTALALHAVIAQGSSGVWAAAPCTRESGAWQWTLGPRIFLPAVTGASPVSGGTVGLLAGGLWRFHPAAAMWCELHPAWCLNGFPIAAPSLGLRAEVLPRLFVEGGFFLDLVGAGIYPAAPEHLSLWAASVRYAW
jgi:hypothetical protein